MLARYTMGDDTLDSVDVKALVISRGVKVSSKVYRALGDRARLSPDPLTCNAFLLPDDTVVQLTDLAFHMAYIRSAISWDMLQQVKYLNQLRTPFTLELSAASTPVLKYNGQIVTEVRLPEPSAFYRQKTTSGMPYLGNAVLQGTEWVSFQCLWACDYARAGMPCQYCYSGGVFDSLTRKKKPLPPFPTPADAAEIAAYAITQEQCARSIQITGGSTFDPAAEVDRIVEYLGAITEAVGRERIAGEIVVYMTPPRDPGLIDAVFAAGADRVSCSLEIWDENLARIIMPGKSKYNERQQHLAMLEYAAAKYGPGKACSNFIVGLEPVESCLAGAEYLASRGVVPIASVWIPFGRPVMGSMQAPDLGYYRAIKAGFAGIHRKYGIEPPGGSGLNVCIDKDIFAHRDRKSVV